MVPPEVPRWVGPVRVKVGIILSSPTYSNGEEDLPGVEVLRVYRSRLAERGTPDEIEQALLTSLGVALEIWARQGREVPPLPERLSVPEALRDAHPDGRRIRWESESSAEALVELLEQARAVVDGSPISDRSGATDRSRIEALGKALERYQARP